MPRVLMALTLAGLACAHPAWSVDDAALGRCRGLAAAAARLACYDAIAPGPAAAPAAPVAAAPPVPTAATFGIEQPQPEVVEVTSRISGHFEGWGPRSRLRLANGQVWQISDDTSAVYELDDPKVTVRRGALSGFVMEIEGARRAPRVRRVE